MKQRIISIGSCDTANEVLLQICRDDDAEDYVRVSAWHETEDGPLMQEMEVTGLSPVMMVRFIRDFSTASACDFVESFEL